MRVLVIEDEAHLREQIAHQLKQQKWTVDAVSDGEEGLFMGSEYAYDIAIIDLGLPKLSGIEVIQKLRQQGLDYPILILTARGRWQDKVEGLESGADDYLVKPFHFEELMARLNALCRRASGWANSTLCCGPICLNPGTQQVTKNDTVIDLTAYEYRLLHYLLMHSGEVISKTELTDHIYEQDQDRDSNVIEVFVKRLRGKLDPEKELNPIETLRGRGYRLNLPREST
ncbi:response regulator transcription factor [Methylophaga sp.]|uniref:response regulator transcription factor n=1 Tax=Methylophaga sp. TaxID=2024840 RepID=UPI003F6A3CFC